MWRPRATLPRTTVRHERPARHAQPSGRGRARDHDQHGRSERRCVARSSARQARGCQAARLAVSRSRPRASCQRARGTRPVRLRRVRFVCAEPLSMRPVRAAPLQSGRRRTAPARAPPPPARPERPRRCSPCPRRWLRARRARLFICLLEPFHDVALQAVGHDVRRQVAALAPSSSPETRGSDTCAGRAPRFRLHVRRSRTRRSWRR